jgi:repressor LexA
MQTITAKTTQTTLTKRQLELIKCIADYQYIFGHPPSIREMAGHMGLKSTNFVQHCLMQLRNKGVLTYEKAKSRTVRLAVLIPYEGEVQ